MVAQSLVYRVTSRLHILFHAYTSSYLMGGSLMCLTLNAKEAMVASFAHRL